MRWTSITHYIKLTAFRMTSGAKTMVRPVILEAGSEENKSNILFYLLLE